MARFISFTESVLITSYVVLILAITLFLTIINIDEHHAMTTPQKTHYPRDLGQHTARTQSPRREPGHEVLPPMPPGLTPLFVRTLP